MHLATNCKLTEPYIGGKGSFVMDHGRRRSTECLVAITGGWSDAGTRLPNLGAFVTRS